MSRSATVTRATKETSIKVELDLDGSGTASAETGMPFFDHMLQQLGKHAGFDLTVTCGGGSRRSTGTTRWRTAASRSARRCAEALGDKAGVRRFASVGRAAGRGRGSRSCSISPGGPS